MDVVITILEFKNQLKARGYADATVESYRENLNYFTRYLDEKNITDLRKVNHQVIEDYP
jgi:site-specific recombinase XerD